MIGGSKALEARLGRAAAGLVPPTRVERVSDATDTARHPLIVVAGEAWSEALTQLRTDGSDTPVVVVSDGELSAERERAVALGAHGLCSAEAAPAALSATLSRVLGGGTSWPAGSDAPRSDLAGRLAVTPRQLEVLELVARGLTNSEIAGALSIAVGTVKAHVAAVIAALEVSNRLEAAMVFRDLAGNASSSASRAAADSGRRIAVLAFEDISPQRDQEYFADGVAEELIAALAKVDGLRVAARTSSFSYKGRSEPAATVATELGVDLVIEGSVRRHKDSLKVNVSLINAAEGFPIWSETYQRSLDDVFDVQDEITRAVLDALGLAAATDGAVRMVVPHSADAEACDVYWRARYFWNQRSPEGILRSVQYFNAAIDLDPGYALAHAGLADAYNQIGSYSTTRPLDLFPQARSAAQRALEVEPTLGEAHAALGYTQLVHDWNIPDAEDSFERAIELNPSYAFAHGWYALLSSFRHQHAIAIEQSRRGQALDPLSVHFAAHLGHMLYYANELDDAVEVLEGALEMDPQNSRAWSWLALVHARAERYDAAIRCFEAGNSFGGRPPPDRAGPRVRVRPRRTSRRGTARSTRSTPDGPRANTSRRSTAALSRSAWATSTPHSSNSSRRSRTALRS